MLAGADSQGLIMPGVVRPARSKPAPGDSHTPIRTGIAEGPDGSEKRTRGIEQPVRQSLSVSVYLRGLDAQKANPRISLAEKRGDIKCAATSYSPAKDRQIEIAGFLSGSHR